MVRYNA